VTPPGESAAVSIRIALQHRTRYAFDRPVRLSPHVIRLRPAPHCRTRICSYSLTVAPPGHFLNWQQDPQGNHLARLVFPEPVRELVLTVDLVADLVAINAFDFFLEPDVERYPFAYEPWLATELAAALAPPPCGPEVDAFLARFAAGAATPAAGRTARTIDVLVALNRAVKETIEYAVRMEPGVQTPEETLACARGSCRDSAWLLVALARRLGFAARFCSGYLVQLAADEKPLAGPAGPDKDFTDLHAWAEVFLPGAGWVGFDPTSGLLAAEGHIPLAATPDPVSAAPVTGLVEPCGTDFSFTMRVTRVAESPRTTRPLADGAWERIDALGRAVDAALEAGGVRLTAGGEPTYVSADDFDSPQWNTAALGAEKRAQAGALARRLLDRLGRGGVLLETQGKWYPGEPLPRWALEVVWRTDGKPVWTRPDLLADDGPPAGPPSAADAIAVLRRLASALGVDPAAVMPAHEAGPRSSATAPVAAVLPLTRFRRGRVVRWRTSGWPVEGRVELVPGDSPAGLRLPMALLPWPDERATAAGTGIVRTALVVEVRGGRMHLFLPPLAEPEGADHDAAIGDWLELVRQVEEVAVAVGCPVVLEGYPPAHGALLGRLAVTPDPGVIEVNVPPVGSWGGLVALRAALDEEARACRLVAEKFGLDGRHVGTGGGDHLVLGGPTVAESPFLRRPDLLASLVAYWNNHPALSYLFAGAFIGPTSQAPRVDEARHESLYELEIAIDEMRAAGRASGGRPAPWLVDRLFRNLLVDLTGNTHRAEFCIDKLHSPDTATGRRGLVELRAFEMAPQVRMGLVVQLVVRALVAWLWREPWEGRLVRWGTSLHDRFLLPTFVRQDFLDVLADLARAGFPFEREWFDAWFEFRFPTLGRVVHDGVGLTLRGALEPWHVLGEQPVAGATSRLVDSSLERIEVRATGLVAGRHVIACNGRRVPLAATGVPGEGVAGVRFRAWQPPQCLHPSIPVHTPLVFDVVDLWSGRSLGGCTWHVAHPGGRAYETRPVNALESESRRASRFFITGHTPGPFVPPPEETNPEYPLTLDLRRRPRG
jgi:uncharacterized protein (DUF2126 family)/transglutaminase-like putative cysteine protease